MSLKTLFTSKKKNNNKKQDRKTIRIYGLFHHLEVPLDKDGQHVSTSATPIFFAATKDEIQQAVDRLVYINHFSHYKQWCELRSLPIGPSEKSWDQYATQLIDQGGLTPEDKFTVIEMNYSLSDFVSFLRMFCSCPPLLLPYERNDELLSYIKDTVTSTNKKSVDVNEHVNNLLTIASKEQHKQIISTIDTVVDSNIKEKARKAKKPKKEKEEK